MKKQWVRCHTPRWPDQKAQTFTQSLDPGWTGSIRLFLKRKSRGGNGMCRAVNTSQSSTVHTEIQASLPTSDTRSKRKPWYQGGYSPRLLGGCCFGHRELEQRLSHTCSGGRRVIRRKWTIPKDIFREGNKKAPQVSTSFVLAT